VNKAASFAPDGQGTARHFMCCATSRPRFARTGALAPWTRYSPPRRPGVAAAMPPHHHMPGNSENTGCSPVRHRWHVLRCTIEHTSDKALHQDCRCSVAGVGVNASWYGRVGVILLVGLVGLALLLPVESRRSDWGHLNHVTRSAPRPVVLT
jgi:hypothetical protein